jgi:hypothetical protein
MASNTETENKFSVSIQYYEYQKQIESSIVLKKKDRIIVDGLFDPDTDSRVSLGYFVNPRRVPKTQEQLNKIGMTKICIFNTIRFNL